MVLLRKRNVSKELRNHSSVICLKREIRSHSSEELWCGHALSNVLPCWMQLKTSIAMDIGLCPAQTYVEALLARKRHKLLTDRHPEFAARQDRLEKMQSRLSRACHFFLGLSFISSRLPKQSGCSRCVCPAGLRVNPQFQSRHSRDVAEMASQISIVLHCFKKSQTASTWSL